MNFIEQISAFHRALYKSCGFPALRLTSADERNWFEFLKVMEPLEDTEDGAFTLTDLVAVLADMHRLNSTRDRQYRFAMKPITILRDPEAFRDRVLEYRKKKNLRPRPEPVIKEVRAGQVTGRIEQDLPDDDFKTGSAMFEEMFRNLGYHRK